MQVRYSVNKVVRPPITTNHPKVTKENLLKVNLLAKEYLSLSVATHENGTVLFLLKSFFMATLYYWFFTRGSRVLFTETALFKGKVFVLFNC